MKIFETAENSSNKTAFITNQNNNFVVNNSFRRNNIIFDQCLLVAICFLLYFPFLGSNVIWDRDEGYFAAVAQEMFDNGEWIVPTLNDNKLCDKPILIFWGMLVSFYLFGVSEFSVRFPTIIYGIVTVLLVYHIARRLFDNRSLAIRSAFILATMLLFVVETRGTTCDGALLCWLTAAMTVYVYGCRGFQKNFVEVCDNFQIKQSLTERLILWYPQNWIIVVLISACLGMATLAKGPAAAVIGIAVIGLFLIVKALPERMVWNPFIWFLSFLRISYLMRPLTVIVVIVLIAGPWFVLVGYKTDWEWTRLFFIVHNFERSIIPEHGPNKIPLYYLVTSLFGTFPWSIFFIPLCIDLFYRIRNGTVSKNAYYFILCWIFLVYVIFSIASTKLPHYVFPAYPATAILIGGYLFNWRCGNDKTGKIWTFIVPYVLIVTGIGITIVLNILYAKYFPNESAAITFVIGLLPLIMGVAGVWASWKCSRKTLDVIYIILAIIFIPLVFQWTAAHVSQYAPQRNGLFRPVQTAENSIAPPILLCTEGCPPSWFFYYGKPIRQITAETLQQDYEKLGRPPAPIFIEFLRNKLIKQEKLRPRYFSNRLKTSLDKGQFYIVTNENDYNIIQPLFGKSMKEIHRMRRFMKPTDLLLFALETLPEPTSIESDNEQITP
ncbi:MAG: glycosyltransferase family 39 protein [Planctomycetaceae bacterium]|jgi:4-amino-4-deoxy-L-arabinose transferase-like glycosyltransferase|nr:glycosyltransferase family 39 protein [Planctomycetaceae bacterium]